ncbi:MAG: PqqD family protein [bacterium]
MKTRKSNVSQSDLLSRKLVQSKDIVFREVAGETLLVPIRSTAGAVDYVYNLNEVGTYIWGLLDGSRPVREIVDEVVKEFEVSAEQAEADLLKLVEQLVEVEAVREA